MRRREFIARLGSAAVWPVLARANDIRPRIAVLTLNAPQDDARRVAPILPKVGGRARLRSSCLPLA
jgi:hypothetical protein